MSILSAIAIILLFINVNISAAQDRQVEVRDDTGAGIKSELYLGEIDPKNWQGKTDDEGNFALSQGCKMNTFVLAKPCNPFYHEGKQICGATNMKISIRVTKKAFLANLEWNAEQFEESGKTAKAALIYSELGSRKVDRKDANAATEKTIKLFAQHVQFDPSKSATVFDPAQQKKVISKDLANAIRLFQVERGLKPTGQLNYKTLSVAAGVDVGTYIFGRVGGQKL